jgi:hypothetical protein
LSHDASHAVATTAVERHALRRTVRVTIANLRALAVGRLFRAASRRS